MLFVLETLHPEPDDSMLESWRASKGLRFPNGRVWGPGSHMIAVAKNWQPVTNFSPPFVFLPFIHLPSDTSFFLPSLGDPGALIRPPPTPPDYRDLCLARWLALNQ